MGESGCEEEWGSRWQRVKWRRGWGGELGVIFEHEERGWMSSRKVWGFGLGVFVRGEYLILGFLESEDILK